MKACEKGDFQNTKKAAVKKKIERLDFGKRQHQKSGKMKSPAKSDNLPVNQLPNSLFK
jgi:hypothetical protein